MVAMEDNIISICSQYVMVMVRFSEDIPSDPGDYVIKFNHSTHPLYCSNYHLRERPVLFQ